jgi:Uma2 family endonuclease
MCIPDADATQHLTTAEELEHVSIPGKSTELIRGRLVVREPPGTAHGRIAASLAFYLGVFVKEHGLGYIVAQDTGFRLESNPDTVRAPDVAFVARDRSDQLPDRGYAALAPDLVAEIASPGDSPSEVLAKIAGWLEAGVRLAWVIAPHRSVAQVYRRDGTVALIASDGSLDGEDVLPAFTCPLAEVLRK